MEGYREQNYVTAGILSKKICPYKIFYPAPFIQSVEKQNDFSVPVLPGYKNRVRKPAVLSDLPVCNIRKII